MTPEELKRIGEALFGAGWKGGLARVLNMRDEGRIAQMASGKRHIPPGLRGELTMIARQRRAELDAALEEIANPPRAATAG